MALIPRDTKCRYCGKRIFFVEDGGRRIPCDAGFTPYKRRGQDGRAPVLYTAQGGKIYGDPLPAEKEIEADGWAHIGHVCPAGSRYRRPRPMSKREKWKEEMA